MLVLKNILVASDFSEPAEVALRYGLEVAKEFDARLHVLHVVEDVASHPYAALPVPADMGQLQTELENNARTSLAALVPEPDRTAVRARLQVLVSQAPGWAILRYATDEQIDLIIVGTHGRRGMARLLLGSVARHVSGGADCPVLTVRAHERDFVQSEPVKQAEGVV